MAPIGKKSTPAPPPAPDYAAAATAQGAANVEAARTGAELTNTNQVTPYGSQIFTRDPNGSDQWTSTISFSPEQQRLYDLQTQGQRAIGETANSMLGRVQGAYGTPLDTSGAPARVNSIGSGGNYNLYSGPTDAAVNKLDTSGIDGTAVRDAIYRRSTAMLDPQFDQREARLREQLINSGNREGSQQYNEQMADFARERDSAYGDARDRAITAEGDERSRMLAEILSGASFQNAAQQQGIDNRLRVGSVNNQTEAQKFQDALTGGNFQNTQRGAALDEAAYLRSLPLNEYNALSTGAQVTNPSFRGTGQVQGPAAAPVFAGAQAQGQSAIDLYNAQMAQANSARSGLTGLLGTGLTAGATLFSDRRLKTNIRRIGKMSVTGLPVYRYDIGGRNTVGVMADEVAKIHPDAVSVDPATGYSMVDYARIMGTVESL